MIKNNKEKKYRKIIIISLILFILYMLNTSINTDCMQLIPNNSLLTFNNNKNIYEIIS